MLDSTTKRRIDDCRDILVGKVPDPKSQIEQITVALIYKFMHDMDQQAVELGGKATFFAKHTIKVMVNGKEEKEVKDYAQFAWPELFENDLSGEDRVKLYSAALESMEENPGLPTLFRDIFKNAYLPYRDPATLREFLKRIDEFSYDHSEKLGDAFEYLLSIMGSQGDAGQFRTPRHLIDFMTAVLAPEKHETILDPACGTAGFLISAYKYILKHNSSNHAANDRLAFELHGVKQEDLGESAKKYAGDKITPDQRKKLVKNIAGYDISPDMVRLSLVNMYLHGFPEPHIYEYDTLTSDERWEERFDVILANPPFMSPKGGIKPHGKYSIPSTRSEVLFVDYMAEHLNTNGRAMIVVPEGIIFQSGKAYKALRKKLVDDKYLVGVISLPSGMFNPYSGVKTSLLWFDRALAKKTDKILFVKVEADGFDLGAQRRPIAQNDLPDAYHLLLNYKTALASGAEWEAPKGWEVKAISVERKLIAKNADFSLSGDRYLATVHTASSFPYTTLGDVTVGKPQYGSGARKVDYDGTVRYVRITDIDDDGRLKSNGLVSPSDIETDCMLEKGDLLFARSGSVGRCYVHAEKNGQHQYAGYLIRYRIDRAKALPEYIFCLTRSKEYGAWIESMKKSGTISNINAKEFASLRIPLPPLAEQEAIVAEVEGYQKVIDGARQVVAHYRPRITIDPEWPMVELQEVSESITDGDHMPPPKTESGVPFVTISNIDSDGQIDFTKTYFVSEEYFNKLKDHRKPKKGDVLYTVTGSYGIPVLINDDKHFCFQRHIGLVRPSKKIDPRFLYGLFSSPFMKEQADRVATGVAQKTVSLGSLRAFKIPLPPLLEQQRIVAELEEERALVAASKTLVEKMEAKVRERVARVWGVAKEAPVLSEA